MQCPFRSLENRRRPIQEPKENPPSPLLIPARRKKLESQSTDERLNVELFKEIEAFLQGAADGVPAGLRLPEGIPVMDPFKGVEAGRPKEPVISTNLKEFETSVDTNFLQKPLLGTELSNMLGVSPQLAPSLEIQYAKALQLAESLLSGVLSTAFGSQSIPVSSPVPPTAGRQQGKEVSVPAPAGAVSGVKEGGQARHGGINQRVIGAATAFGTGAAAFKLIKSNFGGGGPTAGKARGGRGGFNMQSMVQQLAGGGIPQAP